MAQLRIRYFAAAAEAAGTGEEYWECSDGLTLADLASELVARHGEPLARVLAVSSFLVDGTVTKDLHRELPADATVDVLPPFAGG